MKIIIGIADVMMKTRVATTMTDDLGEIVITIEKSLIV